MFAVITGIAVAMFATRTFGIVATLTSLLILGAAWFTFLRLPTKRRTRGMLVAVICVTALVLYSATFAAFRLCRTYEFSLAPDDDPNHRIVVFSSIPAAQQFARNLYYPLIRILPGHCVYPTSDQNGNAKSSSVY